MRRSSAASAFLSDAARAAAARRTTITLLAAESPRTAAAGATVPFTLGLEGRYADVLATIRSFSTLRVAASLVLTALTRSTASAGEPTISATLRVDCSRAMPMLRRAERPALTALASPRSPALELARRREPRGNTGKKLDVIRAAARHDYPVSDIKDMLAEIEKGYWMDSRP